MGFRRHHARLVAATELRRPGVGPELRSGGPQSVGLFIEIARFQQIGRFLGVTRRFAEGVDAAADLLLMDIADHDDFFVVVAGQIPDFVFLLFDDGVRRGGRQRQLLDLRGRTTRTPMQDTQVLDQRLTKSLVRVQGTGGFFGQQVEQASAQHAGTERFHQLSDVVDDGFVGRAATCSVATAGTGLLGAAATPGTIVDNDRFDLVGGFIGRAATLAFAAAGTGLLGAAATLDRSGARGALAGCTLLCLSAAVRTLLGVAFARLTCCNLRCASDGLDLLGLSGGRLLHDLGEDARSDTNGALDNFTTGLRRTCIDLDRNRRPR